MNVASYPFIYFFPYPPPASDMAQKLVCHMREWHFDGF